MNSVIIVFTGNWLVAAVEMVTLSAKMHLHPPTWDYFWVNQPNMPRPYQITSSAGSPKEEFHQNAYKG